MFFDKIFFKLLVFEFISQKIKLPSLGKLFKKPCKFSSLFMSGNRNTI